MTEKTAQSSEISTVVKPENDSRVLPLAIAGLICFVFAVSLGYGSWYFFGSHNRRKSEPAALEVVPPFDISTIETNTNTAAPQTIEQPAQPIPETPKEPEIEGVVKVAGGEFTIGGGETGRPLKRAILADFAIAETEVTNSQYAEFVKATNHAAPEHWKDGQFAEGTENYPVAGVSWDDAKAFCKWLGTKLNKEVRLPTEAEWELAARGRDGKKFPWGDKWNKDAAISIETGGKVSAVKSFALNRSPFGAFDMLGNVWEWTEDKVTDDESVTDEHVREALKSGQILRVVKGGSAKEKAEQISAQARYEIPEKTKNSSVGFRYVIVQK